MKRFVDRIIKLRWAIVLCIPLITIMMASSLKNLEFEGSYRIWFGEESSVLKEYDAFRAIFGNDDMIAISFKREEGIFNKDALQAIDNITQKLWQTEYIARVDSLTNYQYVYSDTEYPDEIIVEDFIENIQDLSEAELAKKRDIALGEDLIIGKLISADAKTTMIVGRMTAKAGENPEVSFKLRDAVVKIIQPEIQKYGFSFHLNGGPVINTAFIEIAQYDGSVFTPAVLLVAMLLLFLIFRKFSLSLVSILVVIFTFLIVLSIQVALDFKLNNFTANIPVFVVAIGIADAMHLVWIYIVGRKKGLDNHESIAYSLEKNLLPLFLTSITTAIGFASLSISSVIPIQTLGIATASAAVLAFILTVLFVPAALAILNPSIVVQESQDNRLHLYSQKYTDMIIRHDTKVLIVCALLFVSIAMGIFKVNVDSNTVRYFKEDVPFRASTHFIQDNLSGPMAYEIVVDSQKSDGIKEPHFMQTVDTFYTEFYEKYPDVRHISSLMDVVKKFNEVMNASKSIPQDKNLIAQYLLLYSLSLPQGMEINDKMDIEERLLRVTASINIVDSSKDLEMIRWVETWWEKTPYTAKVNGQTSMFANMQHDVTNTLIYSILLAVGLISIIMFLIFKNLKMLPLFIAPNILPIVLVIGAMGWFSIDIDIGVAIAGAIIIGVAVDDTIHFMVKYTHARKRGEGLREALVYVMSYAGSAIIFTTMILSLAFLVFIFSDFNLNFHFGIVTATALVIAVIVDLVALPALLSKIDNKENSLLL